MGKWKYFNFLVVMIILGFMYYHIATRYDASLKVYILSSLGWLTVLTLGYYIFVFKIRKSFSYKRKPFKTEFSKESTAPKNISRERPKVVFKKDQKK